MQQAYDDPLVMAEYRMTGEAFEGKVVYADPGRRLGEGRSATIRPVIVVETGDPVAIEAGREVVDPAATSRRALSSIGPPPAPPSPPLPRSPLPPPSPFPPP